jgi:hypothetical protein
MTVDVPRLFLALNIALTCLASTSACSPPQQKSPTAKRYLSEFVSTLNERVRDQPGDRNRERRFQDPTVYVDGVPMAVLTYLELPPSLPTRWRTLTGGKVVRRFRLAELVTSLGLDLAEVKQVHLYGGRDRISILDGSELRRMKDDVLFSFTQSDRGKPRMHYPDETLNVNGRIDLMDNVAIYIKRDPPRHEGKYATLTFADGVPIEGIPYAVGERAGGTRIYVDGSLRTFVKRRSLPNAIVDSGPSNDAPARYLLQSYIETMGIAWTSVKCIEILGGNDVLARLDATALAKMSALAFTLPKRSRGLIALDIPEATEPVQAIAMYIKTAPPDRVAQDRPPADQKSNNK